MSPDIRWIHRFDNFKRSLQQLEMAFTIMDERELNELEQQGVIQAFTYNYAIHRVLVDNHPVNRVANYFAISILFATNCLQVAQTL